MAFSIGMFCNSLPDGRGGFFKLIFLYFLLLFPYSDKRDCFEPSATLWESFLALVFVSCFYLAAQYTLLLLLIIIIVIIYYYLFIVIFIIIIYFYISIRPHSLQATFPLLPILSFCGIWDNPIISIDIEKRLDLVLP